MCSLVPKVWTAVDMTRQEAANGQEPAIMNDCFRLAIQDIDP